MDKKVCLHCNEEKFLQEFSLYKARDGNKKHRNVCKACRNTQDKKTRGMSTSQGYKKRTTSKPKIIRKPELTPLIKETKIDKIERILRNMFTDKELKELKKLVDNSDEILKLLDNKTDFSKDDDIKIKKSVSISKLVHERILAQSKNSNLSYSETLNNLLKRALNNE